MLVIYCAVIVFSIAEYNNKVMFCSYLYNNINLKETVFSHFIYETNVNDTEMPDSLVYKCLFLN